MDRLAERWRSLPSLKSLNLPLGRDALGRKKDDRGGKPSSERAVYELTATAGGEGEAATTPAAPGAPAATRSEDAPGRLQPAEKARKAEPAGPRGASEPESTTAGPSGSGRESETSEAGGLPLPPQPRASKSLGPLAGDPNALPALATALTEPPSRAGYQLPPSIQLSRFLYSDKSLSEAETPRSAAGTALVSEVSGATVVVNEAHQAKGSLSLTASIEDYAKKADPSNWSKPLFRKSQFVRIQPGTYPVPHRKRSESRNQYTTLDAFTKGTVHQIHKETETRDPREFVTDEGAVCYRVWIPRKVNSNVEFIFVEEGAMTPFRECIFCTAYATLQCSGCKRVWYCSEECQAPDWRHHRADCRMRGRAPPPLLDGEAGAGADTPASSVSGRPPALPGPRRRFMDDGSVLIINGYKPAPEQLKGHTTILPLCLRPLTLDEELAPPLDSAAARLLRTLSHRLRRALHSRRQRREAEAAAAAEAAATATIPEGDEEAASAAGEEETEQSPAPETGARQRDSDDEAPGPQGGAGSGGNAGGTAEGGSGGDAAGNGGSRRESRGGDAKKGRRGGGGGGKAAGGGGPRKDELGVLKQGKEALPAMGSIQPGGLDAILSKPRPQPALSQRRSSCIISGVPLDDEPGCSLEDSCSEPGSPGAESLVEGQGPAWRHALAGPQEVLAMPRLPRIRVRALAAPPQPQAAPAAAEVKAQAWPPATAAHLTKTPPQQRASPKSRLRATDSKLPEVFKRLTAGSKYGGLGVRLSAGSGGGGPGSPTKKSGKGKGASPFRKQQAGGFRPTVLAPPPF